MSPFELLGLAPDADERAIKRAYAQRLRITRPEDDPQGFQQLHAAYQAALEHVLDAESGPGRMLQGVVAVTSTEGPEPRLSVVPASADTRDVAPLDPPPLPRLDPDDFCRSAFALSEAGDAAALGAWLASRPELWSLQRKAQLGNYLVRQLYRQQPPMPGECMETLLRFFDLDHALAGHDPLARLQLERRTRLAWQLQHDDEATLAARLAIRTPLERRRAYWILRQLQRPFRWLRVLWLGLNPVKPGLIADFIENVSEHRPQDLPATIDRAQLAFWLAAADRQRVSQPRLVLGGARSAAMLLLGVLLAPLLSLLCTDSVSVQPMLIAIGILMLPSALWAMWMAWSLLVSWYLQPDPIIARRSLHTYLVPTMCVIGVVLGAAGQDDVGLALIAPALWLALRRYWYRHASRHALFRSGHVRLMSLLAIPVLHAIVNAELGPDLVSFGEILAAVAMLAWAADLRRQRQRKVAG